MRPYLSSPRAYTRGSSLLTLLVFLTCCCGFSLSGQAQVATPKEKNVTHYALIFHTSRALSPEEIKQRSIDISDWVKKVMEMGVQLDPRALGQTVLFRPADNGAGTSQEGSSDPLLSNLVFFDSSDREQALTIAKLHPSVKYGVSLELREWTSPRAAATK